MGETRFIQKQDAQTLIPVNELGRIEGINYVDEYALRNNGEQIFFVKSTVAGLIVYKCFLLWLSEFEGDDGKKAKEAGIGDAFREVFCKNGDKIFIFPSPEEAEIFANVDNTLYKYFS